MKPCTKCGAEKELEEFFRDSRRKDGRKSCCKECTPQDPIAKRASHYKSTYGITIEDYDRMLAEQGGKCAICPRTNPVNGGRFHVDHDHNTGKIRGLLCSNCNTSIGLAQDNPEILISAAHYILSNR